MFQSPLYKTLSMWLVAIVAFGVTPLPAFDTARSEIPDGWRDDATLHDVCFVNTTTGWAVGNQGVILRTTDGGQNWVELQNIGRSAGNEKDLSSKLRSLTPLDKTDKTLPLTCRWHSVHFIDDKYLSLIHI